MIQTDAGARSFTFRTLTSLCKADLFSKSRSFHFFFSTCEKVGSFLSLLLTRQSFLWIALGTALLTYLLLGHYFF